MQKLLKNNYQRVISDLDVGIITINSNPGDFGKIIFINSVIQKSLGYSNQDLKHSRISLIQPKLIKKWHKEFLDNFQSTGCSKLLHHSSNLFLLKKNGYVIPYQLNIQFHYSMMYGSTFIAYGNSVKEMQLKKMGQKFPSNKVMFFLCESEDGRIRDISESCFKQLGLDIKYIDSNDLSCENASVTIMDICKEIDLRQVKQI